MVRRFFGIFALLVATSPAVAAPVPVGIPVTIEVVDGEGLPVPTAVIRHPQEADRHRVNTVTGRWSADVLYLPDGTELVFAKKTVLEFEISAPGHESARIQYTVRKRKNVVQVALPKVDLAMDEEDPLEEPLPRFARAKPLDK